MNTLFIRNRVAPLELPADYDDAPELPRPTQPYRSPETLCGRLALGQTQYGRHYFLDGQPVYDGSLLEVSMNGVWRRGLFTWSAELRDAPRLATLAIADTHSELIDLEPDALCRWTLARACAS